MFLVWWNAAGSPPKSLLVNFLMSGLRGTLWPPIDQSTATEMSQPLCGSAHWPFSLKLINLATLPFCCQSSKPKCHKKTGTLATDGEGESNWALERLGSRKFRLQIRTCQHVGIVQNTWTCRSQRCRTYNRNLHSS